MPTVIVRATKIPRCHACCEEKEQQSRQRPKRCRYRDLSLLVPCRRPRRPRMRRAGQARHFSCKTPSALPARNATHSVVGGSRLQCGIRTASTLDAGLCAGSAAQRLPWCRASVFARRVARLLRVFDRLPTGSFGRIRNHRPMGRSSSRLGVPHRIVWPKATSSCAYGASHPRAQERRIQFGVRAHARL